jgi:hypothetical protein
VCSPPWPAWNWQRPRSPICRNDRHSCG